MLIDVAGKMFKLIKAFYLESETTFLEFPNNPIPSMRGGDTLFGVHATTSTHL